MTERLTLSLSQELKSEIIKCTFKVGGESKKKKKNLATIILVSIQGEVFPGGLVVKNPPAKPGFNPWSRKIPHTLEQWSLRATTIKPALQSPEAKLLKPMHPRACGLQQGNSL